ncbi:hypothetical protein PC129_g6315 [Phytophthora cactorum]|uniref:Uncharacterized protein n=2 Tax=Phytophthora cactorum TaxID=29920 RepID=A0A329SQ97_9STRA|nr:hypothetical protein PC112_g8250 [Phytophthora cactorum]KAG2912417.1 hypothetical protein PC114_g8912 [Phytophthora cactorum]KAG3023929.1 hypothetical protein PC120_g7318 [Phytophthora cactorum]KAG3092577.1 hypothetical protein PC121_g3542 [Phytophthora cactorum]KAG3175555.1 hypothetical protein C6341_g9438 [Phytophthora cactorum]
MVCNNAARHNNDTSAALVTTAHAATPRTTTSQVARTPEKQIVATISAGSLPSRVMDDALGPWDLYDLMSTTNGDTLDTMKDHFRRFRPTRKKSIEGADSSVNGAP